MSVTVAERLQRVRPFGERKFALGPGLVWFANPDLGTGMSFPIQKLGYRAKLSGPTGAVEVFPTFINPTAEAQKAYFLFPLDRNIAPVKMRAQFADQEIDVQFRPKPDESAEMEQDSLPPELSALFKTETENVLAISLGEIPPAGLVEVQVLLACFVSEFGEEGLGFGFRLPLLTSRALTSLNEEDASELALANGLERGAQVAVSIKLEAAGLQPGRLSTSQPCAIARRPDGEIAIEFDRKKGLEARDFVMDYQLWSGSHPKAWLRSQGRHFLLNFLPPCSAPPSLPRRIVFLIDGSDEMNRVGVDRCRDCLSRILESLNPTDRFALVAFNRDVAGFQNGDFVESAMARDALAWLDEYRFSGVADLKALLGRVVTLPRQPDSALSVVLLTAGRLGNEPELYRLLQGSRDVLRFFPIVLGRKADPYFARAASRLTGGRSFRPLTKESVSRVAERILEETNQPVLEVVGIQDRGLGFQGDTLTPKYPSGLSATRPINVLGVHAGSGGVEAGGKSADGSTWSEAVEPSAISHQLLPVVWALVKSVELEDESRMLDRAERVILTNMVKSLSEDFGLPNRHTVAFIQSSVGHHRLSAPLEPWRWHTPKNLDDPNAKSATELLEEQKKDRGIKGGRSSQAKPGRGLTMKESLGKKKTLTVYGSKLGHRNKLSGAVKEGLFSKPMLGGRGGASSKPMLNRQYRSETAAPPAEPKPVEAKPTQPSVKPAEMPTVDLGSAPSLPQAGPISGQSIEERRISPPPTTREPAPPVIAATPDVISMVGDPESTMKLSKKPKLPTPAELAAAIKPSGRTKPVDGRARDVLRQNPEFRAELMKQMRQLHGILGESQDPGHLNRLTTIVLESLATVAPESELLTKAYGLGYQARTMLDGNLTEAKKKLKFWLSRFAKLF